MRGCAGARSTQARTAHLQGPIPTGAPPSPQPFTGLGFARTMIALLSSYLFFLHLSRPGGCNVWLGLAGGFLPGRLPAFLCRLDVQGLALGLSRGLFCFLQMFFPWSLDWTPPIFNEFVARSFFFSSEMEAVKPHLSDLSLRFKNAKGLEPDPIPNPAGLNKPRRFSSGRP